MRENTRSCDESDHIIMKVFFLTSSDCDQSHIYILLSHYKTAIDHMIVHTVLRTHKKYHDDVIKWEHFPRYWPFVRGINRCPVNSPHKGQWPGALIFSLICVWINGWVNPREAGDLRRHRAHYDVSVMTYISTKQPIENWTFKWKFGTLYRDCTAMRNIYLYLF